MAAGALSLVDRTATRVFYVEVADQVDEIRRAWPRLEAAVGSLRGRHFLGVFDPIQGWYRACVKAEPDKGLAELPLPDMTIPGGRFARIRLRGQPPDVYLEIGPTYERLMSAMQRDDTRPSLESYRRLDEIDLLMPVIDPART